MISTRRLPALAVLLAFACVPTVLHSYIGMTVNDDRSVELIPSQLNGLDGRPSGRSPAWVAETYRTSDFIERNYGPALTLFIARSFDAKSLYHHPENGVAHGDGYDRAVVIRRPERPAIPMFVLDSPRGRSSVYALRYGDQFIERPMRFQLQNALELVVRPRRQTTLFFVRDKTHAASPNALSAAEALLFAAIDAFAAQPGGSTR